MVSSMKSSGKQPLACVIIQTPAYGTLSWGPFPNRDEAEAWVAQEKYWHELMAAYGSVTVSGLVIMVVTLYDPDVSNLEGGE